MMQPSPGPMVQATVITTVSDNHWISELIKEYKRNVSLYENLPSSDWIRLLVIEPGLPGDIINCHLIPIQRDSAEGKYEALSYCWRLYRSSIETDISIQCNHLATVVSPELRDALQYLRHPSIRRIFWVDALCINQEDNIERSQQVSMMGSIYQNASRTIVWLGKWSSPDLSDILTLICRIVNTYLQEAPAQFSEHDPATGTVKVIRPIEKLETAEDIKKIDTLFSLPWFSRRWVSTLCLLQTNSETDMNRSFKK
jgi:hypothetical protein